MQNIKNRRNVCRLSRLTVARIIYYLNTIHCNYIIFEITKDNKIEQVIFTECFI